MDVGRYTPEAPSAAMRELLNRHTPLTVAGKLHIHNAHVYRWRQDGHVSPTLEKALIKEGYVPAPPKRFRLHYECGRGDTGAEHKAQLEAEAKAAGCSSFGEYVDYLRRKVNSATQVD